MNLLKPRESETPIPIYLCCDENYVPQLCVVMASAVYNTKTPLHFAILSAGLSEKSRQNIIQTANGNPVDFFSVTEYEHYFKNFPKKQEHISIAACYRYLIPVLNLPYNKGIYLDCDVIVNGDLKELIDFEIGDSYLAGADDFAKSKYLKKIGLDRYFNSGVLLMNLKKMREEETTKILIDKTLQLKDDIKYLDQDVLNLVFKGSTQILPTGFGAVASIFRKRETSKSQAEMNRAIYNPLVVHFTGPDKPWKIPCGITAHPYTPMFFKYLKMTPYFAMADDIFGNFDKIASFWWYFKRHLFFFLRPHFYKMRSLYKKNYRICNGK